MPSCCSRPVRTTSPRRAVLPLKSRCWPCWTRPFWRCRRTSPTSAGCSTTATPRPTPTGAIPGTPSSGRFCCWQPGISENSPKRRGISVPFFGAGRKRGGKRRWPFHGNLVGCEKWKTLWLRGFSTVSTGFSTFLPRIPAIFPPFLGARGLYLWYNPRLAGWRKGGKSGENQAKQMFFLFDILPALRYNKRRSEELLNGHPAVLFWK